MKIQLTARADKRRRLPRKSAWSGLAILATAVLAGCGGTSGSTASGPILIGGLTSLTGPKAPFGLGVAQGTTAGIYAVNKAGGVLGRKLSLVSATDGSDPVDAAAPAQKLIDINHVTVQDGEGGAMSQVTAPLFAKAQIPMFIPGGDVFYDNNSNPYVWRTTPSDSQLGVALALYGIHRGYKTAVTMFTTGSVQQGLKGVVLSAYHRLGGTIVGQFNLQPDLTSYSSEVARVLALHPQVIFAEMDPGTASAVFKDFEAVNGLHTPFIGTDDMIGSTMTSAIGLAVQRQWMTNVEGGLYSSPAVNVFNKAIAATANTAALPNSSYGYDGIILASLAMVEANSTSGTKINAAIPKITAPGGTVVYSYAEGVKALKAGKRITYVGASGPFYYNKYHNVFGPFIAVRVNAAGSSYDTLYTMTATALAKATG